MIQLIIVQYYANKMYDLTEFISTLVCTHIHKDGEHWNSACTNAIQDYRSYRVWQIK